MESFCGRTPKRPRNRGLIWIPTCSHPRHGPGAVAGGERHNEKWKFSTLFMSVHQEWPYYDYIFGVRSSFYDEGTRSVRSRPLQLAYLAKQYAAMQRVGSPTARFAVVPKDSRGPRIISIEPKELMYLQQGVARHLMDYIERHPFTRGRVNFENQEINAALALRNSVSREFATIDLSDASDRVSVELVKYLFPARVTKKLLALRSQQVQLPDGRLLPLRKFAPMGSALCFPIESIVFWALAVGAAWEQYRDFRRAREAVYVYGDDLIIRDDIAQHVVKVLESVALKVNHSKCFMGPKPFRESCGTDALIGHDVTPQRVRVRPPQQPSDGPAIQSYCEYASNALPSMKLRSTALEKIASSLIGRIPRTPIKQSFISIVDADDFWLVNDYTNAHWRPDACYYRARLYTLKTRKTNSPIEPWWRLQHDIVSGTLGDPSLVVARSATQIRKQQCVITYLAFVADKGA